MSIASVSRRLRLVAAAALLLLPLSTPVAQAFGDGGSSTASSCSGGKRWCQKTGSCVPASCRKGTVWSSASCSCAARSSEAVTDADRYDEAVALIESEQYADALDLLHSLADQNRANVLTYVGFATRKLGDLDGGIRYYHRALALEPDNALTREYLGEGLLLKCDVAGAREQLARIEAVCGRDCHSFEELAAAIAAHEANSH